MARTREQILEERRQLKAQYAELFDSTAALLFRHDPVGINFEDNTDEYESEAPRLRTCHSADEVLRVVYEEFVRWFASSAGPQERYAQIASEIWDLWRTHRRDQETTPPR